MNDAVIGFLGVIVGALMTWLQAIWSERKKEKKQEIT
jgi:hypothetical protein